MNASRQVLECLFTDIHKYRIEGESTDKAKCLSRTIRDFTFMEGAVKIELCALSIDDVRVTAISGDIDGVFGLEKKDLINQNVLKLGGMKPDYIYRVFEDLEKTGFVFKEMQFNGRTIHSILMPRDGNNLVEIAFVKEVIK